MNTKTQIDKLVKRFAMQPHHEGGYFVETFRSKHSIGVSPDVYQTNNRTAATSIYFLLPSDDFSSWHRVKTEEIWNHHQGSTLVIHSIDKNGQLHTMRLGDSLIDEKASYQIIIPANTWFCAYVEEPNQFSLVGVVVAPAFDFADFELADKETLTRQFPAHHTLIERFTR